MTIATNETTEDDRTTPIGLFNYARSYWKSAFELQQRKVPKITHPLEPVNFLYAHAIELFLKSYLRLNRTVKELKKMGHNFECLIKDTEDLFIDKGSDYKKMLCLIAKYEIYNSSRYISTGYIENPPTPECFEELCRFLDTSIKSKMIEAGFPVK